MRSVIIAVLACGILGGTALAAEEQKAAPSFWDYLKTKIENLAPVKKAAETTAVGGVRGAKDAAAEDLYWKSEEQKAEVPEGERTAFVQAYEAFAAGRRAEALQGFESFVATYPRSTLLEDAMRAIDELKAGR